MLDLKSALRTLRRCLRCQVWGYAPGCPVCHDSGYMIDDVPLAEVAYLSASDSLPQLLVRLTEALADERRKEDEALTRGDQDGVIAAAARGSAIAQCGVAVQAILSGHRSACGAPVIIKRRMRV